jgi:hypothetical protein
VRQETNVVGFVQPETKAEKKESAADGMAALRAQLATNATGYHFHKGESMFATYAEKAVNFVTAKNGVFRVTAKPIGIFATKVGDAPKGTIPGIVDLKEGFTITIPKIPFVHWVQVLSFYRDVYTKDKTEASVLFFWNHDELEIPRVFESGKPINGILEAGQLVVYCPEQRNSGSLSEFHMDGMVTWLRQFCTPLCETHSHHTMGAFWSGTDDANENMTQLYGVYGTITNASPAFLFRYVHGGDKTNISMWELFEKPNVRLAAQVEIGGKIIDIDDIKSSGFEYKGPWPMVEYPDDWMAQHSKSVYVAPAYSGNYGGYGNQGRGGTYGTGGAANTQGSSSRSAHYPSREDIEEGHYWEGYRYYNQNPTQTLEAVEEGKKKEVGPLSLRNPSLTELGTKKVIATKTSTVEVISAKTLSPWVESQVSDLVECLSEAGYDHFIFNLLKKVSIAMA